MSNRNKGFGHHRKQKPPQNLQKLLNTAINFHQQGKLEQAIAIYQQILNINPHHLDALSNLGVAYKKLGRIEEAISCYRQVLQIDEQKVEIWFNLGNTLQQQNQNEEAEHCYREAIRIKADFGYPYFNLAKLLQEQELYLEAKENYQQAIKLIPNLASAHTNLGNVLKMLGDIEGAIIQHQQAIVKQPNYAEAYYNLGNVFRDQTEYQQALTAYQKALQLKPQFAQAWLNIGGVYEKLDQLADACKAISQAIAIQPDYSEAYLSLAKIYQQQGNEQEVVKLLQTACQQQPDDASIVVELAIALQQQNCLSEAISRLESFLQSHPDNALIHCSLGSLYNDIGHYHLSITHLKKAIALEPNSAAAHTNLGYALIQVSSLGEGIYHCQKAIELNPQLEVAHLNLGFALKNQGKSTEAIASFRSALEIKPDFLPAQCNLLYSLNYDSAYSPEEIAQAHFDWGKMINSTTSINIPAQPKNKKNKIRVGYVSPDFKQHSVAYFIEPILRHHNQDDFAIYCYANVSQPDAVTKHLQQYADYWRNIYGIDDQQVCQQIKQDQIDILVDLAGHTGQNRLPLFALKPAPIQITYIGYPNTTGLETMDYRFTDEIADPFEVSDAYYSEKLIRLPNCVLCYQPPTDLPPVNELPAKTLNVFTFGSFNNLPKLTPEVIAVWSKILQQVPKSRLILKVRWFDDPHTCDRFHRLFAEQGIEPRRVKLIGKIDNPNHHLAFYGNIDIALDPFPYNGTTTTCEALMMGIPTLTMTGNIHASKVGSSLLNTVGLPEWVATSSEEYIDKAIHFANDWELLTNIRKSLRQQMLDSALCNASNHTQNIEETYSKLMQSITQS